MEGATAQSFIKSFFKVFKDIFTKAFQAEQYLFLNAFILFKFQVFTHVTGQISPPLMLKFSVKGFILWDLSGLRRV